MPAGPAAVEGAVYSGLDEVSGALPAGWDAWGFFRLEEREVRDVGDSALWLGRAHLRGTAGHVHFLMAQGTVMHMHGFLSCQEALEAAGLRE